MLNKNVDLNINPKGPYALHTKLWRFFEVGEKIVAHKKNLLEKWSQLWKKVVVCMEDNCIFFAVLCVVCEGF